MKYRFKCNANGCLKRSIKDGYYCENHYKKAKPSPETSANFVNEFFAGLRGFSDPFKEDSDTK
jgi:hypothetical protein